MLPQVQSQDEPRHPPFVRAIFWLVMCGAALYLVSLFYVMLARRTYPFDLEWMEGGMLTHAARLVGGRPIYARPSLDFIAYFYTPLYPTLVAALSNLVRLSFGLGRTVSAVATLGTLLLLYDFGRREAGACYGLLAVGLYAALFRTTGAFYDLVRPDALASFLAIAGAWILYYQQSLLWTVVAALVFVAAYFTKQTSIITGILLGLWLILRCRRRGSVFLGTALSVGTVVALELDRRTGGWFRFYALEGHQTHSFLWKNALLEYWRDLLFLLPAFCVLPVMRESYGRYRRWWALGFAALFALGFAQRASTLHYDHHQYYRELWYENPRWALLIPPLAIALLLGVARWRSRPSREVPGFFVVFLVAGVLASLLNHSTQWAYSNCFMPIALGASLYAPLAVASFLRTPAGGQSVVPSALLLALLVQETALWYNPRSQVPNQDDYRALATFQHVVSDLNGKVFIPAHPFFAFERGGPITLHQVGIGDVYYAGGVPDLESRMRRHEFAFVILDSRGKLPVVERHYRPHRVIGFATASALYPRTGFQTRPYIIYRAK